MSRTVFRRGASVGVALGACVIVLAILGLTPSLSWIPEVPLIGASILLPVAVYGLTGFREGRRSGQILAGALAGAVAGGISGAVAGIAYVLFGKSLLNIVVGLCLGAAGGAAVGAVGAWLGRRTTALGQRR
jgi:hypothetical protein